MFELPDTLDGLSAEELQALIDSGLEAFHALNIGPDADEVAVAEGERIAPLINQLRGVQRQVEADAAGRRDRAQALLDAVANTPEEPDAPEDPNQPPPDPNAPPVEPTAVETITPDAVLEPVPASASPVRRAAANAALPQAPRPSTMVALTAAADVPGFPTSAPLEGFDGIVAAIHNRMKGIPTTNVGAGRRRYGAALIRKQGYGDLTQDDGARDDYGLVWHAGDEARLPGNSLVAAGGWCAPSQTLYDMCQYETVEGVLDTPEINITRGGIRWTPGPDFSDIYTDCGFLLTEEQAIAGEPKNCCIVDCPPFDEIRLDAIGLCVKTPLLTNAAYPELTRRFLEGSLVAHAHKVNAYMIEAMTAAAGTPVTVADAGSISITLQTLEIQAIGMRYRYRMGQNTTIEVVAPFWLRALWRADLAMRAGTGPTVSDAQLSQWFTDRGMSVQWVFDFQDLVVEDCAVTVPDEVTVLMYPAGTWVKGTADVINVDAVYDSSGLECNVFTALFMEEGILAVQRCTHTCAVTLPICVSGRTAAQDIVDCLSFATGGGGPTLPT